MRPFGKSIVVLCTVLSLLPVYETQAVIVYSQPPRADGAYYPSSWWDPDGSDYDQYVWDAFTLTSSQSITEIRWRGAYRPDYFGAGGPVVDFTVEIWSSIQGGSQPDIGSVFAPNPLVQYDIGGNAGETPAGTFGGVAMYDYQFILPTPFQAVGGTKYWVQIEAWQHGIPDWSIAAGTGGDGHYFRRIAWVGDWYFQLVSGDAALTIIGPGPDCSGVNNCSGHGTCVATNTCACDAGWTGANCTTPTCTGVNGCSGHGLCVAPDACQCDAQWTGPDCATSPIPTLSTWGAMAFSALLVFSGAFMIARRNAAGNCT